MLQLVTSQSWRCTSHQAATLSIIANYNRSHVVFSSHPSPIAIPFETSAHRAYRYSNWLWFMLWFNNILSVLNALAMLASWRHLLGRHKMCSWCPLAEFAPQVRCTLWVIRARETCISNEHELSSNDAFELSNNQSALEPACRDHPVLIWTPHVPSRQPFWCDFEAQGCEEGRLSGSWQNAKGLIWSVQQAHEYWQGGLDGTACHLVQRMPNELSALNVWDAQLICHPAAQVGLSGS